MFGCRKAWSALGMHFLSSFAQTDFGNNPSLLLYSIYGTVGSLSLDWCLLIEILTIESSLMSRCMVRVTNLHRMAKHFGSSLKY